MPPQTRPDIPAIPYQDPTGDDVITRARGFADRYNPFRHPVKHLYRMGMLASLAPIPGVPRLWDIPTKGINLKSSQFLGFRSLLYGTKSTTGGRLMGALAGGSMFGAPGGLFGFAFGDLLTKKASGEAAGLVGLISPAIAQKQASRLAEGTFFGAGRNLGSKITEGLFGETLGGASAVTTGLQKAFGFQSEKGYIATAKAMVRRAANESKPKISINQMKNILMDPAVQMRGAEKISSAGGLLSGFAPDSAGRANFLSAIRGGKIIPDLFKVMNMPGAGQKLFEVGGALHKNLYGDIAWGNASVVGNLNKTAFSSGAGKGSKTMRSILKTHSGMAGAKGFVKPSYWQKTAKSMSANVLKTTSAAAKTTSAFQKFLGEEYATASGKTGLFGEFGGVFGINKAGKQKILSMFEGPEAMKMAKAAGNLNLATSEFEFLRQSAKNAGGKAIGKAAAQKAATSELRRQGGLAYESMAFRVGTSRAIRGIVGYQGAKWLLGGAAGLVKTGVETLERGAAIARTIGKAEFGSGRALVTPLATTERTRAIQAIQNSGINARQYLGREANMFAE